FGKRSRRGGFGRFRRQRPCRPRRFHMLHRRPIKSSQRKASTEPRQLVVFKEDYQIALLYQPPCLLKAIYVIPAVLVKRIADHGRTQREAYLRLGHTRLQLIHHFLGNDITLLDFDFIWQRWNIRTSGEQQQSNQRKYSRAHPGAYVSKANPTLYDTANNLPDGYRHEYPKQSQNHGFEGYFAAAEDT